MQAEIGQIGKPEAHGKAYASFGFWVSAIIGCVNVDSVVFPLLNIESTKADQLIRAFKE